MDTTKRPSATFVRTASRLERAGQTLRIPNNLRELLQHKCFLIVDTNAWIDSLEFILSLKEHRKLTVIVPSAVVQELDGLRARHPIFLGGLLADEISFIVEPGC
jgi:hypothetical protein